jgi:amino acid adenylation domain-containing protein
MRQNFVERLHIASDDSLIHTLFEAQVARDEPCVAVMCEGESVTYAELNARANRLARHLRDEGVGADQLVGLYLERSISMVVGLLAILKAGGAYVPLDPAYPADRISYMLEDAAPRAILTQDSLRKRLPASSATVVSLDGDFNAIRTHGSDNLSPEEVGLSPQHLAYVIYTSGSTGRPKGVMIEHASVVNFLHSMRKQPGIDSTDRLLAVTTIAFDIAALEIYLPLVSGATVVLTGGRASADADSLAALLEVHEISMMQATPATWRLMLHGGWQGRKGLKVLCGGEALTADLAARLIERAACVWNMYGPTETTIWSCAQKVTPRGGAQLIEPVGGPIANTHIYILDEQLRPVRAGEAGEIYIGGAGVARGYLRRPELTAERFLSDPFSAEPGARMYRTGDRGCRREDGAIDFLGRTDHQVKIRGYRIELGEIEAQLAHHSGVREAAALALEDGQGEKRLVAYVVPQSPSAPPTVEALRAHLAEVLPEYMMPSVFVALERLPLTPNGKLDRSALPAPDAGRRLRRRYEAPQGRTEEVLAGIWQTLLRVDRVGRSDNFFEIGGYSMLALDLRTRIQSELGTEISLSALIEAPTVERLAQVIEGRAGRDSMSLIRQGRGGPPVFLIHDGDGETLLYRNLALRLDPRHAVFGLNPFAAFGVPMAHTRIRDMAAYHIEKIRAVQPHSPYLLGGMCAGGVIAFEMALQLQSCGERVALVALLDAADPEAALKPWRFAKERLDRVAGELRRSQSKSVTRRAAALAGTLARKLRNFLAYRIGKSWRDLRDATRMRILRAALDRGRKPPRLLGPLSATTIYLYAEREYRPVGQLADADLVLFRATCGEGIDAPFIDFYADPLLGWSARSSRGVRAVDVPGGHTSMLQEPDVAVLARRMQEAIDESLAQTTRGSGRSGAARALG